MKGIESILGDADFYDIKFPINAPIEGKLLLIGAVIMIDYLYYEEKDEKQTASVKRTVGYGYGVRIGRRGLF